MSLEESLLSLLAPEDRPRLVRALCACAREQLPRAHQVDPFNTTVVETAEAWAAGTCPLPRVREIAHRAKDTRGGLFPAVCVKAIVDPEADLEKMITFFARQLPFVLWFASEPGQKWTARGLPREKIHEDPKALAQVAAVDAALATLAERTSAA